MMSEDDFDEPDEPPGPDDLLDDDEDDGDMVLDDSSDEEDFLEFDPSRRYGRYAEVLGKGAMKTVYRAYDMVDCKEVAWNKAKPPIECSDEQAIAVRREIHILQRLNHKGIIRLHDAWTDNTTGDTNFITELCFSTLLEYRLKHKHVSRKAVKSWGRQILKGLVHLHMQDPPIIHRDLKCENILLKCRSNTALKIGDFGAATFLDETHHMHTLVGTPEFMAPEMFQEDYNELVDVYSFGMCMLELLTRECPYSECKSLGQIYKKVINGEKPKALLRVTDVQALRLINRCLLPACKRPSASELLADPFLQFKDSSTNSSMKASNSMPNLRIPTTSLGVKNMLSGQGVVGKLERATRMKAGDLAREDLHALESADYMHRKALCTKSPSFRRSYRVMGRVEDQNTLRLKIRIQESSRSCDIDFPFDLRYDSPRSVAEEMVRALDYSESDLVTIAVLIREEIAALLPNTEEGFSVDATSLDFQGSRRKYNRGGDFYASRMDAASFSDQFSYSSARELHWIADQVAESMRKNTSFEGRLGSEDVELAEGEEREMDANIKEETEFASATVAHKNDAFIFDSSCKKLLTSAADGKIDNSALRNSCSDMASLSYDKCRDVIVSPAENGQICNTRFSRSDSTLVGATKSRDSFSCKCCNEQAGFAAKEVASNISLDISAANLGTCNASHANVGAALTDLAPMDGKITGVSDKSGAYGRENNTVLDSSHTGPSPSHRSSGTFSRFGQLPAGIGILLSPPTEQGLRRARPSYVNAFA